MKGEFEVEETHDEAARRELVDPVRKWGPRLARALAVLVGVLIVIGWQFGKHLENNTNAVRDLLHTLEDRQTKGCHRTNIERRQANEQNFADYVFFAFTIRTIGESIEHPERPQTPREHALGKRYLEGLRKDIAKKSYVPLTFCSAAAKHNLKRLYEPPKPVSFARVHGHPPKTAFKLQAGQ